MRSEPPAEGTIRVLVGDGHTLFRRGLIALPGADARFEVVGVAGDAREAQRKASTLAPDAILADNHRPGVRDVDASPGPSEAALAARVLMLTGSDGEREVPALIARGPSNKESARGLHIAETVVKIHARHLPRKLDLRSRVRSAAYAAQRAGRGAMRDRRTAPRAPR